MSTILTPNKNSDLTNDIPSMAPLVENRRYTFVTVVYESEYPLLLLQAYSMHLYCPKDLIEEIIIIDNSDSTRALPRWKNRLLAFYGKLADYVRFVSKYEIAAVPKEISGYFTQQLLKLMVSRIINTERYIVLDAKAHLIYPLERSFLETEDGRACTNWYSYIDLELRCDLERVLSYLGLEATIYIDNFMTCGTPFIVYTNIVRNMIDELSTKEQTSFENLFIEKQLYEFFLYAGFMIIQKMKIDKLYFNHQMVCPAVYGHHDTDGCIREVVLAREMKKPFFLLHRRAIARLSRHSRRWISKLWRDRSLFRSTSAAERYIITIQIRLIAEAMRRRYLSPLERFVR